MGVEVETLEDLLRPGLWAVCVGTNPALKSVEAGHYYQGRLGQRHWGRFQSAGLLPDGSGWEDDRAFAAGIGFTDIVKRPTRSASEVTVAETVHGVRLFRPKVEAANPCVIIFTFKAAAEAVLGRFQGHGFIGLRVEGAEVFVMPGPYVRRDLGVGAMSTLSAFHAATSRY